MKDKTNLVSSKFSLLQRAPKSATAISVALYPQHQNLSRIWLSGKRGGVAEIIRM